MDWNDAKRKKKSEARWKRTTAWTHGVTVDARRSNGRDKRNKLPILTPWQCGNLYSHEEPRKPIRLAFSNHAESQLLFPGAGTTLVLPVVDVHLGNDQQHEWVIVKTNIWMKALDPMGTWMGNSMRTLISKIFVYAKGFFFFLQSLRTPLGTIWLFFYSQESRNFWLTLIWTEPRRSTRNVRSSWGKKRIQ